MFRVRSHSIVLFAGAAMIASSLAAADTAAAAGGGTWSRTGGMKVARANHTLTRLQDGSVLTAGGDDSGGSPMASSEVFDAIAASWHLVGAMTASRANHTATLLRDGRVLVTGGCCDNTFVQNLASAELYDPHTRTWTATGSMSTARVYHTATLLLDGRVLIVGGCGIDNCYPLLGSAEVYDPATGTFTPTGSLHNVREYHTATLLADGRVLVAGGFGGYCCNRDLTSAEIWNPGTGVWTLTQSLLTPREQSTAVRLADGRVLVTGGCGDDYCNSYLRDAELFDPGTGAWTTTGIMNVGRVQHIAVRLRSGQVLVAGGFSNGSLTSTETYNPGTGVWTTTGSLHSPRYTAAGVLLVDGRVLVSGGVAVCQVQCSTWRSAEVFA